MLAQTGLLPPGVVVDSRIAGVCLLAVVLCGCQTSGVEQAYPDQPLRFVVPRESGTQGAVAAHVLATALADELGQTIETVNLPGGNGVVAHVDLAQSPPDGYTLGILAVEVTMAHWTGITSIDYNRFSPIALVATNPPAITVKSDAPWQSIDSLIASLKAESGSLVAGGTYFGGIWDLSRVGFLEAAGLDPSVLPWDPSPDPALALQELVAGNIDIVIGPLSETDSLRRSDQVRTLAVMADKRLPSAPNAPTLKEMGIDYASAGSWFALAAPENLPNARVELLRVAVWNLSRQSAFRKSLEQSGFQLQYMTGSPLDAFIREEDARHGVLLSKAGLALE